MSAATSGTMPSYTYAVQRRRARECQLRAERGPMHLVGLRLVAVESHLAELRLDDPRRNDCHPDWSADEVVAARGCVRVDRESAVETGAQPWGGAGGGAVGGTRLVAQ